MYLDKRVKNKVSKIEANNDTHDGGCVSSNKNDDDEAAVIATIITSI